MNRIIEKIINKYDIYLKHNDNIYLLDNLREQNISHNVAQSMKEMSNYYYRNESGNLRMLIEKISVNGFLRDTEFTINCIKYKYDVK